ncbi:uncharacterized protein DNG_01907 [Cephalotrichum gorgonifer]|uniref:UFSP1/2/DUB catalytic domain-containing protein n=1 Tax=Cephalotrichum gorgonifer TaxID=2041049 RepID=A0AAE8MRI2_9PEZI|nr:uncharacterized protein DNG_01907 [Cephalotrichum gorgonifer]
MSDLGVFAYEKKMPSWLESLLRKHGEVSRSGVVVALARYLSQTAATEYAYLCDPCVQQIFKLRREGQFCGYRNTQMLLSYVVASGISTSRDLQNRIPSIFELQEYIEAAWRQGIRPEGLVETGGIKGTRKFIGTPEVEALLTSLEIPYKVHLVRGGDGKSAAEALIEAVEVYFKGGASDDVSLKVRGTLLPPLYFQTPRHSMTIVGLEKLRGGGANVLVFDPKYHDAERVSRAIEGDIQGGDGEDFTKLYRRDLSYLKKHSEFELLE